jgi:hypothetical protein
MVANFTLGRMALTEAELDDFAAYAREPETWLATSRHHMVLFTVLDDRLDALRAHTGRSQDDFSACLRGSYLHAGLAVENAVRASLVRDDPDLIAGGKIDRRKLGERSKHSFVDDAQRILGSLSADELNVLTKLEEYVAWAGKYSVPMRADVFYDHGRLQVLRTAPMNEREIITSVVARLQAAARTQP